MAHRGPAGVADQRVALCATEPALTALADGLRRSGLAVATVAMDGIAAAGARGGGYDGYDAAIDRAAGAVGELDALVWAATAAGLAGSSPFADLAELAWQEQVGGSLQAYVAWLQAAERRLRGHGGRVIVVVPTIGLAGAAGLVAWATVAEGQRSLAKSVARVWGANRITVNCVAVPPALLAGTAADPGRPNLQQPALPDPGLVDAADVIASLCREGMAAVTGATIAVDGGRWMPA